MIDRGRELGIGVGVHDTIHRCDEGLVGLSSDVR